MSKIYYIYDAFSISFRFITIFLSKCYHTVSGETPTNACPHGNAQCVTYREGMVYTSPKDMRLQFFETQEQCMAMKQEITNTYLIGKNV